MVDPKTLCCGRFDFLIGYSKKGKNGSDGAFGSDDSAGGFGTDDSWC